jgi:hypothetical protein
MTHANALDFLLLLGCEVERVAQKDVAIPVITRVIGDNRLERFGESNLLHQQKMCPSLKIIGNPEPATASESKPKSSILPCRNGSATKDSFVDHVSSIDPAT